MRNIQLLLLPLFFSLKLAAQFHDNFSDGDLITNPVWQGDLAHFQVNANFECQLNAPAAGDSSLLAPVFLQDSAAWEFYFRLEFDPFDREMPLTSNPPIFHLSVPAEILLLPLESQKIQAIQPNKIHFQT